MPLAFSAAKASVSRRSPSSTWPAYPAASASRIGQSGRALLEDILRLQGYQVLTATTVQEGDATRQRCSPGRLVLVIANIYVTAAPEAREGCAWYQLWRAQHPGLPFLLSGDPTSAA